MSAAVVEDKIFQALADPSRRAIFESLTRGEAAVKDLTARFDISQPAVSQHLSTLKSAGLVKARREGRFVYYQVELEGDRFRLRLGGRIGDGHSSIPSSSRSRRSTCSVQKAR